jgi:hypothetical protein
MPVCSPRKRNIWPYLALLALLPTLSGQQPAAQATASGGARQREILTYAVEWRLIRGGTAKLSFSPTANGWQGDLHLESAGLVSKLFKVDDNYTVQVDNQYCATSSYMKAFEGKRQRETMVTFDRNRHKASYLERDLIKNAVVTQKEIDIPACVSDILAGLERMRTLKLDVGKSGQIPVSDGKKFAQVKVEAQERETVKTPAGEYKTIRYEVFLFNDVVIGRKARGYVWLTDDAAKLPVQIRVKMQFLVGTVNLSLEKIEH